MLISRKVRESNIAEYVLYMFQIEDIIRAYHCDIDEIREHIILRQVHEEGLQKQYTSWYSGLIDRMKEQGILETGHLEEIVEIITEIHYLHNTLVNIVQNQKYIDRFNEVLPVLSDFQAKSGSNTNLIASGFDALYTKILMKLKRHEISEASAKGFDTIATFLGYLASHYKKMKLGDLNFVQN